MLYTSGIFRDVADALKYMHEQRLMHADISASNIVRKVVNSQGALDSVRSMLCDCGSTISEASLAAYTTMMRTVPGL